MLTRKVLWASRYRHAHWFTLAGQYRTSCPQYRDLRPGRSTALEAGGYGAVWMHGNWREVHARSRLCAWPRNRYCSLTIVQIRIPSRRSVPPVAFKCRSWNPKVRQQRKAANGSQFNSIFTWDTNTPARVSDRLPCGLC